MVGWRRVYAAGCRPVAHDGKASAQWPHLLPPQEGDKTDSGQKRCLQHLLNIAGVYNFEPVAHVIGQIGDVGLVLGGE